jgi:acetyl-CoA synthetase
MRYPVPSYLRETAWINSDQYEYLYQQSINDPDAFWTEQAQIIDWIKSFTKVKDVSFHPDNFHIRWFEDGILNVSYNCLDRHLATRGNKTAIIWEGDSPYETKSITYHQLHKEVCKFANCLKSLGVSKGDYVTIYLPMIIEATVAMLACARIGAVHSVVFGGFSADSLANRIIDCQSKIIITADEGFRNGHTVPYKENCDEALAHPEIKSVEKVVVVQRSGHPVAWDEQRDLWYSDLMRNASEVCEPEPMHAEDPLFVLYTSGSTAKPKGIMHTTGGYIVYAALTHRYVFDYHEPDIFWCTADIGWITGHTYVTSVRCKAAKRVVRYKLLKRL